nr:hypothetical protein [Tanacetum cinerariifolium]
MFQAKGDLMKSIQTFLERFNCIPFEEKPQILFQTWETFFAIQCSQPEDSNELFQKLLKDLKELAEYDQSTSMDRSIFLNDNEDHPVQNKESPENSPEENVVLKTNQEPPQDSEIHQLIEECSVEVPEKQKQKIKDTMFELVKICHHKQFLCIHDDVDDLIESALDSKLLLINSINSQRFDKNEKEVKNVIEQPAERRNRAKKSLHNFRVVHKSSISFKNTSQIFLIHSFAPIQSTKEPEHLLRMGYEHFSITPETKSNEVTESNADNLLPIPSKCEVTLEYEIECNMPTKDVCSPVSTFSNPFFKDDDDLDSSDDESLPEEDVPAEEFKIYSNPLCDEDEINSDKIKSHCFNDEICLIENLVYDNSFPRPPEELNAEIADTIIESIPLLLILVQDGNSQQEEIDIVTETDDVLPPSVENDNDDYDLLLEEVDLFLSDDLISPGIENVADDPEGDDNSSISRPPLEPPDDELDLEPDSGKDISAVVSKDASDDENDYYYSLMFVIQFFLPYLILPEISPLLLSAESEDMIFDPGLSPRRLKTSCVGYCPGFQDL